MVLYSKGRHVFGLCNDNVENGLTIFSIISISEYEGYDLYYSGSSQGSYSLPVFYIPWAVYYHIPKYFLPNIRYFLNGKAFVSV